MFPFNDSLIKKVRSVRPDRLVALWPQNEPLGHGVSTEVIRGYHGAYTAVTLGQTGLQGTGLTSAGYDGATSYNNIYTAEFANDNLFGNPGFETAGAGDPDFWAVWAEEAGDGALANEGVIVHEGADACKQTTGLGLTIYVSNDWVSVPNTTYRVRFWTRGDGVNSGLYRVRDVTNAAYVTDLVDTGITAAAYGMCEFTVTAPAGCVLMRLYLHGADVNGAVTYFDACDVRRAAPYYNQAELSVLQWFRVLNVGIWGDATVRKLFRFYVDANNTLKAERAVGDNTIAVKVEHGGVNEFMNWVNPAAPITWQCIAVTISQANDRTFVYGNGVEVATSVGLGVWAGPLDNLATLIGATSPAPAQVWSGWLGPTVVWDTELSPEQIAYLSTP